MLVVENVADHVITSVAVELCVSLPELDGLAELERVAVEVRVPLLEGVVV